jgi:site-specific recombinase XerC
VRQHGGKQQDIPLPAAVMRFPRVYVDRVLATESEALTPDTPVHLGQAPVGWTRAPMMPKNIWRLCETYGKLIGYPELKPHDLRHGVAVEVLEQRNDLEEVRALLGRARGATGTMMDEDHTGWPAAETANGVWRGTIGGRMAPNRAGFAASSGLDERQETALSHPPP